jgi:hypothetical protein
MQFPVTLYHKHNGSPEFLADARNSKYTTYPIVVQTQEEFDQLAPGWHEDPVAASAWVPDEDADVDGSDDEDEDENEDEDESSLSEPKSKSKKTTRKK